MAWARGSPLPEEHSGPRLFPHPVDELDDGRASAPGEWRKVGAGLQVSFASKDGLYPRRQVPQVPLRRRWREVAWRGERVNVLLLAWSRDDLDQVRVSADDAVGSDGAIIPGSAFSTRFVRYVASNLPAGGSGTRECEADPSTLIWVMPDLLDSVPRLDLPGGSVRPVWISLEVPADAAPGSYQVPIRVKAAGRPVEELTLEVEVRKEILPPPADWKFRLDLWQNPWAVAHQHQVAPWSSSHLEILRPHLRMLADAGAKFVTTYLCHSPWRDETYILDQSMVEWTRKPDGAWEFDYRILDLYVETARACGITDAITVYTMLPWKHRVRYLDQSSGDYRFEEWPPGSPEFEAFWSRFLADLRAHLIARGWFGRTYMGINENALEDTLGALRTLRRASEDWKVTYAGVWHPELNDLLDDYCVIIDQAMTPDVIRRRRENGSTTTFYVCCHPARPNNYPFSPPAENTWMGWHALALGYDGFLRWAYDSWTADPARDARHVRFPAGDCFMVYPGCRSSVRFERLREGIVDFEKVRVLREKSERAAVSGTGSFDAVLKPALDRFTFERAQKEPAADAVNAARAILNDVHS